MQKQNKQKVTKTDGNQIVMAEYQGVLPMPEMLKGYNDIDPTFADRIFRMTEKQNDANIEITKETVKKSFNLKFKGQFFSFFIVLLGYAFAVFSALVLKNTPLAITSIVSSTVTVAVAAINGFLKQ